MKTTEELIECAQRELKMRNRLYPGWVISGKIDRDKASHELDCMSDIVEILKQQKQPDLFHGSKPE